MARTRRTSHATGARAPAGRGGALTTRAVILGLTLAVLALTLAYPVKQYLSQRHEMATLQSQHDSESASVRALRKQIARWDDPAYVKAQAKERLHYVMPGDTAYVVVGQAPKAKASQPRTAVPKQSQSGQAWYAQLWRSVEQAGTPTRATPDIPPPAPQPSAPPVQ